MRQPKTVNVWLNVARVCGLAIVGFVLVSAVTVGALWWWAGGEKVSPDKQVWGLTYSKVAAQELKLDPHQTYLAIVNELRPKRLRLIAYWPETEPQRGVFDFREMDFQVDEAERLGIPYVLTIGRRVPRYPECFTPDWAKPLAEAEQQALILTYMHKVVERYDNKPNLIAWQVENEAFVSLFGECPKLDEPFFARQVDQVRQQSRQPILTTDSGELSLGLFASKLADVFGTTLYRTVINKKDEPVHWIYPAEYYTRRANLIQKLHPNIDQLIIAELQAEPWGNAPLVTYNQPYFDKSMSPRQFDEIRAFAQATGLSEIYMWGAEWWYYEKLQGENYYWNAAKQQFAASPK